MSNRLVELANEFGSVRKSFRHSPGRMAGLLLVVLVGGGMILVWGGFLSAIGARIDNSVFGEASNGDETQDVLAAPPRMLRPADVITALQGKSEKEAARVFGEQFDGRPMRVSLSEIGMTSGMTDEVQGGLTVSGRAKDGTMVEVQVDEKHRGVIEGLGEFGATVAVEGVLSDVFLGDADPKGERVDPVVFLEQGSFPALGPAGE